MTILINSHPRDVSATTVQSLLRELGLLPSQVATEHNGTVLFPHELSEAVLHEGDRLEIVRVVAGG